MAVAALGIARIESVCFGLLRIHRRLALPPIALGSAHCGGFFSRRDLLAEDFASDMLGRLARSVAIDELARECDANVVVEASGTRRVRRQLTKIEANNKSLQATAAAPPVFCGCGRFVPPAFVGAVSSGCARVPTLKRARVFPATLQRDSAAEL